MEGASDTQTKLKAAIAKVRRSIKQVRDRKETIGEEATKTALIAPLLRGLGWDTTNLDEVFPEYKHKPKSNPVDYALLLRRKPCLFVEAKPLDTNLDDLKWKHQILGYASSAGVEWFVLTDGNNYCIYKTRAKGDVDEKLFRRVALMDLETEQRSLETLELLSKSKFDTVLEDYWEAERIDRRVQAAVGEAFEEPSGRLVNLIRDMTSLKRSEVRKSLQRGNVIIDFPPLSPAGPRVGGETQKPGPEPPAKPLRGVKVSDLLAAGLVKPGDRWRFQSGKTEAHLEVASDGSLVIDGERHSSPSAAGRAVTGWGSFDGWKHWRYQDKAGEWRSVNELRAQAAALAGARPEKPRDETRPDKRRKFKVQFRWMLDIKEDGSFTIDCRYLADESKSFQVSGRQVPANQDFKPARKQLFEQVYEHIKPLFPDLPDGRVRAKAWSGVHKVYPVRTYFRK